MASKTTEQDPETNIITDFELSAMESNDTTHLVGHARRPGVITFLCAIEYYWFKPTTMRSALFQARMVPWGDQNWLIGSFPTAKLSAIKRLAAGLRLTIDARMPMLLDNNPATTKMKLRYFPGGLLPTGKTNRCIHTIESRNDNPLHGADYNISLDPIYDRESTVLHAFAADMMLTAKQIYDFIYGFDSRPDWLQTLSTGRGPQAIDRRSV